MAERVERSEEREISPKKGRNAFCLSSTTEEMSGEQKQEDEIRILHVDDEPDFLAITKAFLERKDGNFRIASATSAEEGIELLNAGKYEVVLSDYQMPGMDGLEFLQHLRQRGSEIPFIIFTGRGREEVAIEALNKGANHYLQKGGDVKSLYGTVAHVIKEKVEKKRAEDKIAEVEKELRIILDSVPAMIFYEDRDSNFTYVNKLFAASCGKNPVDFIDKSTREIFPEESEKYINDDKEVVKSGIPKKGLIRELSTAEGKRYVRTDKMPLKDADGNVTGIIGFAVDITECKQAEEAVNESHRYMRELIEASLDPLVTISFEGTITDVNHATELVTGCPREKLIGTDFSDYFTEPEKARQGYWQVFREGHVRDYPLEIKHRDGKVTPVLYNAAVYYDTRGEVAGVFAAARDSTERKRAEETMNESHRYTRELIETSLDPLVTISSEGKITDVNSATELVTGCPREELIGTHFSDYFIEPEKARQGYQQVFREGHVRDYALEIKRRDGKVTPVLYNAAVYYDTRGEVAGVFAAARDITERKQAEEARTALIKQLEESYRKMEQSNRELQELVYITSHHLQEPTRKIYTFGNILHESLEGKLNADEREDLEFMIDGAKQMQARVESLHFYTKIIREIKQVKQVDLNKVIEDLKKNDFAAVLKGNRGAINVPEPLLSVHGDPTQVRLLLQNLIGNGLKYHRKGIAPDITVRGRREDDNMVRVEVQDNGMGIDEEYYGRIFEMFQQLHSSEEYEGAGIGLPVCKKIVERHGGEIGVVSTIGEGSTFWVTLPGGEN